MREIVVKIPTLVGDGQFIEIGNKGEIVVQSMCNSATTDIEGSLRQIEGLYGAGCSLIRLTTQGEREVEALAKIKERLYQRGLPIALVADVHFSYQIAHKVAKVANKVRINPGNFAKNETLAKEQFGRLIEICEEVGSAIRIGVNHGSLGEYYTEKYGNTPYGMAKVAKEWSEWAEQFGFDKIVISLKASNPVVMSEAYKELYNMMVEGGTLYPLHLGVTEAGNGDEGRVKSTIGLATLLKRGIGSTIRVSLTEPPINEIPVANEIVKCALTPSITHLDRYEVESWEEFIVRASYHWGPPLMEREIDEVLLSGSIAGVELNEEQLTHFKEVLLQAARRKFYKPDYIACPGCGRTLFNLEEVFEEVKRRTSHLKGLSIAVMGCIVNGPGEMADADYGYVGEGRDKVSIYRGKEAVYRAVPQEEAIELLLQLIEQDGRGRDA